MSWPDVIDANALHRQHGDGLERASGALGEFQKVAPDRGPWDASGGPVVMVALRPSAAASARLCLSAALLVGAGGCAKTPPQSVPETGSVTVGVTSRGPRVETMVFGVSIEPEGIDGTVNGDVGIFTARNVPAGNHVVLMKDLPRGCRVEGDAQRTVRVTPRGSTAVRFVIACT